MGVKWWWNKQLRIKRLPHMLLSLLIFFFFMLLFRNLLHVIAVLEIQSLHLYISTLNGTSQNVHCAEIPWFNLFNFVRENTCICFLIHLFFSVRNGGEKQEACKNKTKKTNKHPFRKAELKYQKQNSAYLTSLGPVELFLNSVGEAV